MPFVVGCDEGMDRAWTEGRPALLSSTSAKDEGGPTFAKRTRTSQPTLGRLKPCLPVLVDADDEEGKEILERCTALVLPAVVWVTSDGDTILVARGDPPLDLFGTAAGVARRRAPEVKTPAEIEFLRGARGDLEEATKAGDVRKMLDAATALSAMKKPQGVAEEGTKRLADLDARGRARLEAAREALAEGRAEARPALERLAKEYAGRDVGREAAAALPQGSGEEK